MQAQLASLPGFCDSFLGHRLREQPNYGFLPHYAFFLENCHRWKKWTDIQKRIVAPVSNDPIIAWKEWRQFRSAQAEISAAYLIENNLSGRINDLEVARPGCKKSCDILATFKCQSSLYLEVKAQSGQQHGSQHPLSKSNSFTPQGEEDLSSWLFEPRVSQSTGNAMVPYCIQASRKEADVLIAMTDIMQWNTEGLVQLGKFLVPDALAESHQSLLAPNNGNAGLAVTSFDAGASTKERMGNLQEVWLFNESASNGLLVIRTHGIRPILERIAA